MTLFLITNPGVYLSGNTQVGSVECVNCSPKLKHVAKLA